MPRRILATLSRAGFASPDTAAELLGTASGLGLWDVAAGAAVDDAAAALVADLAAVPDPDRALAGLHRLVTGGPAGPPPAGDTLLSRLGGQPIARRRLLAVLSASTELGDHLATHPGDVEVLFGAEAGPDTLAAAVGDGSGPAVVSGLRHAYRRVLLGIAAADLTGQRDVEAVMADLSALADATLAAALRVAESEVGAPAATVRLAVLAMGKCGGRELNYVSDVDVLFVAEPADDTGHGRPAAEAGASSVEVLGVAAELARRVIGVCRRVAWQVDAGLRPEGRDGPLVRTVASYRAYYQRWAKTWEFQALLKARPAAGDGRLAAEWLEMVRPLVWQADGAPRPTMVAEVRAMRRRVEETLAAGDVDREIKLGRGGLRDIEFAVQLLQLVHGRSDAALRSPTTLDALRALTAGGYVGRADGEELAGAYRFLRSVEHRLQLQRLRRTHRIPDDEAGQRWLAQTMGYRSDARGTAVVRFLRDVAKLSGSVRRLHEKLLYRPLLEAVARVPTEQLRLTSGQAAWRLSALGFDDPQRALTHIAALTGGVSRTAAIQRTLLPALLPEFADAPEPDRGLLAYRQVSERLGRTPWYLRLLRDSGPVAIRLARLLGESRYVTDLLARDPEALRLLADDAELVPRDAAALRAVMSAAVYRHDHAGRAVHSLRALRRRELFRIGCADLLGLLSAEQVGVALSDLTDAVLDAALRVARAAVEAPERLRLTVIGMGRLGGREVGYGSDADVVFVHGGQHHQAAGATAERLRALLSAPAPDPPLDIDAGLRPEGRQGPLVRSLAAYDAYYRRWSRVWESQALLRARVVAGDEELGAAFLRMVDPIRYPADGLDDEQLGQIRRLKARVDSERLPRGADPATHTKLGRGGLADVEWTVQVLQLRHAGRHAALRVTGTLDAMAAEVGAGLLGAEEAAALRAAWLLATRVRNAMMMVRARPSDQLPRHGVELAGVVRALRLDLEDPGEFLDEYLRTARRARQVVADRMGIGTP